MIVFLLLCLPGYHVGDSFPRLNYAGEPVLGQAFAGGCGRAWASGISLSEGPHDRGTEDAGLTAVWGGVAPRRGAAGGGRAGASRALPSSGLCV